MKSLSALLVAGLFTITTAVYAGEKKEEPKKEPEVKTVCLDVQGKDGKPVIDPKTKKPKQNCTKVKVRQKFEGTKIEDAKKK
jgi:hypothetical protein